MEDFSCLIAFITDEYIWQEIAEKIQKNNILRASDYYEFTLMLECISQTCWMINTEITDGLVVWSIKLYHEISSSKDIQVALLEIATCQGDVRAIQYLRAQGYHTANACWMAAKHGQLSCLRSLHELGYEWDYKTTYHAISGGYINCLKYAVENGCLMYMRFNVLSTWDDPSNGSIFCWSANSCTISALTSTIECLKYAHTHGCPWNWECCAAAAFGRSFECLIYSHENGCPWDASTCNAATYVGGLECLTYAHEHGCPWGTSTMMWARNGGNSKCLAYARANGCPES